MPIDTSMYPQAAPAQNPLQTLSTLTSIRNANLAAQGQAISNQQNMLQMNAQQAIGQAAQGATNPDGSFDSSRFMGLVRGDPRAAYEASQAQAFAQEQQMKQVALGFQ